MKRRDFIKIGAGSLVMASLAGCSAGSRVASDDNERFERLELKGGNEDHLAPRRCELLDFDWRFQPLPHAETLRDAVAINNWFWKRGTPEQAEAMTAITLKMHNDGWKAAGTGPVEQMNYIGYAWFRTTLPPMAHDGRAIHFAKVDDNCSVYLNGKFLRKHEGWSSGFMAILDSAWNHRGPNVLVLLVENTGGPGGIGGPVLAGYTEPLEAFTAPDADDSSWRVVNLPHDYIVEGRFDQHASRDHGYRRGHVEFTIENSKVDQHAARDHGYRPVYPAWYRKDLPMTADDQGKSVWLYFEGVFRSAAIYVNGQLVSRHPGGYTSFHVDISAALRYGERNTLAVYVDPRGFEGWWYEGGGIYRHVWLNVADRLHIAPWGVYAASAVHDVLGSPSATVTIRTTIANHNMRGLPCRIQSEILDPENQVVASNTSAIQVPSTLKHRPETARETLLDSHETDQPSYLCSGMELTQTIALPSVRLWSLEERNLYRVRTAVIRDGQVVDRHEQTFGIRTIRFDADHGFFLNEKHVKWYGTCNHQDFAGMGIGLPDSLHYYRMKHLRETLGCNAIRCSHNPMAPAMYDACDRLGLLVVDENRHPGNQVTVKAWMGQAFHNTWHVENMVLRDRNHPSVIAWSMWNEENNVEQSPYGRNMMTTLMQAVYKYDTTRPITCADDNGNEESGWLDGVGAVEDLLGLNYGTWTFDWLHKAYPKKMMYGSELDGKNRECRGIYHTSGATGYISCYNNTSEHVWQPLATRDFTAGGFVWTGFDYRGEAKPFGWPQVDSPTGVLDLCGFPKDVAYYYRAWWRQAHPLIHIFPHWNWPGHEGRNIPVWCFSNCQDVELILNGRHLGRQTMPKYRHLEWHNAVYEPGRLEARGYIGGKLAAATTVETTGAPAAIRLAPDRTILAADGQDTVPVAVRIVDAHGRVVPTAGNMVEFSVLGAGRNVGVGNGDTSSHESDQSNRRSAFNGLCMVLIQAARHKGKIVLKAASPGLRPATVELVLNCIN